MTTENTATEQSNPEQVDALSKRNTETKRELRKSEKLQEGVAP